MTTVEIDLRDLPADVQDILRDRAIRDHRPMPHVLKDYVLESARLIIAAAEQKKEGAAEPLFPRPPDRLQALPTAFTAKPNS